MQRNTLHATRAERRVINLAEEGLPVSPEIARFTMDPYLEEVRHKLIEAQFSLQPLQAPDPKNFGNWILIGARDNLVLRVTNDRGDILLDVMPSHLFAIGPNESDWFNYDVVARALGIYLWPKENVMRSFLHHFWMIDEKFSPHKWDKTAAILATVEEEKRRRVSVHT